MDPEIGKFFVVAITGGGVVVWLAGLISMLHVTRERHASSHQAAERFDVEGVPAPGTIVGEAEVEGHPEELSTKLAGLLAKDGMSPFGPVRIVTRDRSEVTFEGAGPSMNGFQDGRIRLIPSGPRTRIDYAIATRSSGFVIAGWVAVALGLVALVVAPTLVFLFVLPSPNSNVRAQCFQVFQIVHFLWPPFMFAYRARQPGRMIRARMESLIHNLPYT